jgi:hypothetical protein
LKDDKKAKRDGSEEKRAASNPEVKLSEDIDDFIFEGEGYRCSEK